MLVVRCYDLWRSGFSKGAILFGVAICGKLFHLGVSIGIDRLCIFLRFCICLCMRTGVHFLCFVSGSVLGL